MVEAGAWIARLALPCSWAVLTAKLVREMNHNPRRLEPSLFPRSLKPRTFAPSLLRLTSSPFTSSHASKLTDTLLVPLRRAGDAKARRKLLRTERIRASPLQIR